MLINISKSTFCQKELEFLGFKVSPTEVKMSPRKIEVVQKMKPPISVHELRSVLGFANAYRRFVPRLAQKTTKMRELMMKGVKWEWTEERQREYEE